MRLIAIETSGDWCGVAVGDGSNWHTLEEQSAQAHSERALALVESALAATGWSLANLDGVAFGAGPGSFTGVRLACGLAQGLAFGADLPTIAVSTLAALAQACWCRSGHTRILACIDARVREVYVAAYARSDKSWDEVAPPSVIVPASVALPDERGWFGAGNGFTVDPTLESRLQLVGVDPMARPTAQAVAELALPQLEAGQGVRAGDARPVYVRHRVALTTAERDAGLRL